MFTGIIEAVGKVRSIRDGVLVLDAPKIGEPWKIGESIAVNGVCLTLVSFEDGLKFELSPETLARSSLGGAVMGTRVNIERATHADGRLGGHIVQGHVDTTGTVLASRADSNALVLRIGFPSEYAHYTIDKGSVAVDGVSLTVVNPDQAAFDLWIIQHTLDSTNLRDRAPADVVNLEFDVVAKYVERLLQARGE